MNMSVSPTVLPAVWKLLRLRWRISYNSLRHAKTGTKVGTGFAVFGVVALAAFIFWLSWLLLRFLASPELVTYTSANIRPFVQAIPALIFSALFLGILLTSFGVLLQALYLSGDMDFLLASPVPIRAVFITKLLQAVLPNFGFVVLFGLPVLYGLGLSAGYNFLYYPLVILVMIALALAAAGISALLVMAVVRIFPARRVAEVLGFFGAIFSMLCSQTGNLSNSLRRSDSLSGSQMDGLLNLVVRFNNPWIPLNWAGRGLVELGEGRWISGLLLVLLTIGLAVAAFWFALVTAEGWYYTGWARMQVVSTKKKVAAQPIRGTHSPVALLLERILPAPVRAIIYRDFLILSRDLRQMSQLVSPLIIGILYTFIFFRGDGQASGASSEAPDWFMQTFGMLLVYGNVGMSLFVGWMLLGRLSGNAVSREGRNFWILKASPLLPEHYLAAKFILAYLPALGLGWFFLTGISILQGISIGGFLYGLLTVAMCLAGTNGILLAFGTANANFDWDDPRKMNSGRLGCLGSLLAALFLPLTFGVFIAPLWIAAAFHLSLLWGYLPGILLGVGVTSLGAWLPLNMVKGRIAHLGEG